VPEPALAPIRVLAPTVDGDAWAVTLDGALVNSGTAATSEAAAETAALVAASCTFALQILGLAARVEPTP
jgi:hypothetical protein